MPPLSVHYLSWKLRQKRVRRCICIERDLFPLTDDRFAPTSTFPTQTSTSLFTICIIQRLRLVLLVIPPAAALQSARKNHARTNKIYGTESLTRLRGCVPTVYRVRKIALSYRMAGVVPNFWHSCVSSGGVNYRLLSHWLLLRFIRTVVTGSKSRLFTTIN